MDNDLEHRIDELEKRAAEHDLVSRLSHNQEIRENAKKLAIELRSLAAQLRKTLSKKEE